MREAPALAVSSGSRGRGGDARSRKAKPAVRRSAKPPSLLRRAFARPGVTVAGAAFAAVMTGIVVNAVMFQKGHHPSPLFDAPHSTASVAKPSPVARVAASVVPAPVAVAAPAAVPADSPDLPVPAAPAQAAPAPRVAKAAVPLVKAAARSAASSHRDPIASLLGPGKATGPHDATAVAKTAATHTAGKAVVPAKPAPAVAKADQAPHN